MKSATKIKLHRWIRQNLPITKRFTNTYFQKIGIEFKKRIENWKTYREFPQKNPIINQKKFLILITPWKETPVPFLSTEIALKLNSEGYATTVILDCSNLSRNAAKKHEVETLKSISACLPKDITIKEINSLGSCDSEFTENELDLLVKKIIDNHAVIAGKGESNKSSFLLKNPNSFQYTKKHLSRIKKLFLAEKNSILLIPGGVYGSSASYVAVAEFLNIDYIAYDSGCATIMLNHGGLGAHQTDISDSYKLLEEHIANNALKKYIICKWSDSELIERRSGRGNIARFQTKKASHAAKYPEIDLLVPLNISWDAAAIDREDVFRSTLERINYLIHVAIKHELKLTIRQHPMERMDAQKGEDDYNEIFSSILKKYSNIRYISALDKINTYDLLNVTKVVLPQTSSIGVEAGILGLPVIIASPNYYESFPFCFRARSKEEYESMILKALNRQLPPSQESMQSAKMLYYLTQHCNIVRADFNPESIKWMNLRPADLWCRDEMKDILSSITDGIPLSFLRAKRELESIK